MHLGEGDPFVTPGSGAQSRGQQCPWKTWGDVLGAVEGVRAPARSPHCIPVASPATLQFPGSPGTLHVLHVTHGSRAAQGATCPPPTRTEHV